MLTEKQTTVDFKLCPRFEKTFTMLGKKWNGLIIDVLLENGTLRFKDLTKMVPKCSDRVLVERLKELEADGIVERMTHEDSALIEYQLTTKGESLRNVIDEIHSWSDTWQDGVESCVDAQ
ncbi:winged helix-turn-helix transcriptional regulator [Lactobacillus selangorensis]|nr:winged helix-turn-helix transcriptional regulator [Lactobacillus selangorensis]